MLAAVPPARELNTIGIPVAVADPPISCEPPTIAEISMVVDQLKAGKAAGICGIPGELLRAGGHAVLLSLCTLFNSIWETGVIPADWKRGIVVPLWKGKRDRLECSNYRGITLLSVPGKVFACVTLNRIRGYLKKSATRTIWVHSKKVDS